MSRDNKLREAEELRSRLRQLEAELAGADQWPPQTFYTTYHVLAGFVLGACGAATSLLFNVVGSLLVGRHPLDLIRVYLTFPLGEQALKTEDGLTLAIGCCLYLATGMMLGIPFHLVLTRWFATATFLKRFGVATAMALGLWLFNFYGVLSWLQLVLFGGQWIVMEIPWYVGAATHLVFGWTMLLVQPLGVYVPYRQTSEAP